MRVLNEDKEFNMEMTYRDEVLTHVSTMIEDRNGKARPTVYDEPHFTSNKETVGIEIKRKHHFSEAGWSGCMRDFLESLRDLKDDNLNSSDEERNFYDTRRRETFVRIQ